MNEWIENNALVQFLIKMSRYSILKQCLSLDAQYSIARVLQCV